jgi:hypothetical protein
MEVLVQFTLEGSLKWAPEDYIQDMCDFYTRKNQKKIITAFLTHLRPESYDYSFIIAVCSEHNLFSALISVCTSELRQDYLLPVTKIFNSFEGYQSNKDRENSKKYGRMLLQYLRMILNGKIKGKLLPDHLLPEIIQQFSIYFFSSQIFGCLARFDIRMTIETYRLFFV